MILRNNYFKKEPILLILALLCSLELFLIILYVYSNSCSQQEDRFYSNICGEVVSYEKGNYSSRFEFQEVEQEDLMVLRDAEKMTRIALDLPLDWDEEPPVVKIYKYSNKNWQYMLISSSMPCGFYSTENGKRTIFLRDDMYKNPSNRIQVYIHEYIHYLSGGGNSSMTVVKNNKINQSITEGFTQYLTEKVLEKQGGIKEKYGIKKILHAYKKETKTARRLAEVSNERLTYVFMHCSMKNYVADYLQDYKELAELTKEGGKDTKRINEILEYYKTLKW